MSSINSSNYYSVGGKPSQSNGIAGLMSGMDTESMVEKMLSATQNKINKQEALKQQNLWKQEIYRDMTSTINSFYGKYFDTRYGSNLQTNFASSNFFNTMISKVTSGNAVRITGTSSSALTGDFKIAVKQLAEQAKLASSGPVSGDQILRGNQIDPDKLSKSFNKQISFSIGPKDATVDVTVDLNNVKTQDEMVSEIQKQIDDAGVTGVTAKIYNGQFRLVSDDPNKTILVDPNKTTQLGLEMTGMKKYSKNPITNTDGTSGGAVVQGAHNINMEAGYNFDITLDGVTKSIKITDIERTDTDGKFTTTAEKVKEALQKEVKKAFGENIKVDLKNDRLELSVNIKDASGNIEKGHEIRITGVGASELGLIPGSSSLISTGSTLNSLGLSGDKFSFTINGKDFSFEGSTTLGNVLNTINNSSAGVKISYSSLSDTFSMESNTSGSKYGIEISQSEGDLLTKMFGSKIAAGNTVTGGNLTTNSISGAIDSDYETKTASLKMTVNGREYTYTLPPKPENEVYKKQDIEASFDAWLKNTFGSKTDGSANLSYSGGKINISEGYKVEFKQSSVDFDNPAKVEEAKQTDLALAFGFNKKATSNVAKADTNITDVRELQGITLFDASGNSATKLSDITQVEINGTKYDASYKDGRLNIQGSGSITFSTSASDQKLKQLLGNKDTIELGNGQAQAGAITQGKDAIIVVNGVETTRNSNNITISGITMELTNVSDLKKDTSGNPIQGSYQETIINTTRDTETIIEGFKNFVTDYNTMIEKLNGYVKEDTDYKKYPPLTEAQKKEMSENEIKLWEEKSKKGLVRNDSIASGFLAQMRTILYSKPEGASLALYQIGLETTKDYNDGGKIELDENALRTALSANPDGIKNLFTDATNGLAKQMTKAMDDVAKQSLANPGSLVGMAGVKGGSTDKVNTLHTRITGIESRIKDLKVKYEKEKARYWAQFTNMEKVLANFNSQSSLISQQFGGY